MIDFLGITRERVYSPGRVDDDAAVLRAVARQLGERGFRVDVFDADTDEWRQPRPGTMIFAMCQGPRALDHLFRWQSAGARIINSPDGILNCQRHRTVPLLNGAGVGLPESILVDTGGDPTLPPWLETSGAWIKRGDVHATEADDVVHVDGESAARQALRRFNERGVGAAVIQRHAAGTVLKFYAVRGAFFHVVHPTDAAEIPAAALRQIDALGQAAAARLDVEVYGGDCVYGKDGALNLIDLNDWPSYRSCRASAAAAIANYLQAQKDSQT